MKHYQIQLTPKAWENLSEIAEYLLQYNQEQSRKIIHNLMQSLWQLEMFPYANAPYFKKEKYRIHISQKYLCFYKIMGDAVIIMHITHMSKDFIGFQEKK